ncbi:MAG TPA: holin [Candidatus Limiplasma sp.]|nr:holin [Candidatus Limiplasma sp.]
MEQNRFKSWALWLSVAGAVWTILAAFGLPEKIGITSDIWNTVLNAIGGILIAFGIVNNPTDANNL